MNTIATSEQKNFMRDRQKFENLSGLTRQETLRNRTEKTSVRRGYVFGDICEMRVSKYEVRIVPKRKRELGLLVNMSKQGAVYCK